MRLQFPLNFVTAPLVADLFLLAVSAIGRREVNDGTLGDKTIQPIDIMAFFITLAYIAISIDASGLVRYLAFKALQWGGDIGHRLFLSLYVFFFALGTFMGNDPIILSGTAFLAYMTRVSSNIVHPRAWIYTQFAIANIASATFVPSNPTNLVLAGAFGIKFIDYTAHMVVPVIVTAVLLFPFLLYIVFANESLIPISIKMHELPEEAKAKKPVNPHIPHARGTAEDREDELNEESKLISLEEIMNPFLDKKGAVFGAVNMAITLVTILSLNAAKEVIHDKPVYWVTLPAATIMIIWDLAFGWHHRHETREIARVGRAQVERARAKRAIQERDENRAGPWLADDVATSTDRSASPEPRPGNFKAISDEKTNHQSADDRITQVTGNTDNIGQDAEEAAKMKEKEKALDDRILHEVELQHQPQRTTLVSLAADAYRWCQETFPTSMAVIAHLPFALIPFAFSMFVLVEALVTKGWVEVFAHGWNNWVTKTGTIGAVGGMGFLSVSLCNVSAEYYQSCEEGCLANPRDAISFLEQILVQRYYCRA